MSQCPTCATLAELLAKQHDLIAALTKPTAEKVEMADVEVDVPPAEVLDAMRTISPIRDRTFDANWAYWERNKKHAAANPKEFALDILRGEMHERPTTADAAHQIGE